MGYEGANECYSDAPHGEQFISATRFVTEDQMAATVRLLEHLHLDPQRAHDFFNRETPVWRARESIQASHRFGGIFETEAQRDAHLSSG